jgi:hypothetical protein
MDELKNKMQELYGKKAGFQFQLNWSRRRTELLPFGACRRQNPGPRCVPGWICQLSARVGFWFVYSIQVDQYSANHHQRRSAAKFMPYL